MFLAASIATAGILMCLVTLGGFRSPTVDIMFAASVVLSGINVLAILLPIVIERRW